MNLLDLLVLLAVAGASIAGFSHGFTTRALSWVGLGSGVVVGVLFVDDVANALRDSSPRTRLIGSLTFLILASIVGQSLGIAVGSALRRHVVARAQLGFVDQVTGGIAGALSVLIGVWVLIPVLASASGWPARSVRGSVFVRAIDRWAPEQPSSLATLGRLLGEAPFPEVFERLTSPEVGLPPTTGLMPDVAADVVGAVVKIEGRACDQVQQGSGFVIRDDLVVTNAHVVAGERATAVLALDGRRLDATVVGFDPDRDLAIVRAQGLGISPLPRAKGRVDSSGAVIGYPRGGPQEVSPARIAEEIIAKGTNVYRTATTRRDVFVLAAELAPGDSGGPLFDELGRVVGIAFAVDPGDATTAYALTHDEMERGLSQMFAAGVAAPVDTGPCLVG